MKSQGLSLDRSAPTGKPRSRSRALSLPVPPPTHNPVAQLSDALEILATRMHEAVAERGDSPPGSERHRRADELVAYLNELYVRLQRRMEVPAEIWLLDGGGAAVNGGRSREPRRR